MNADTWLRLATDGLPEAVKTRIAQETREHLADAGLSSAADVDPVLGAPEDTAKELKRLYLTEAEWKRLQPSFWVDVAPLLMLAYHLFFTLKSLGARLEIAALDMKIKAMESQQIALDLPALFDVLSLSAFSGFTLFVILRSFIFKGIVRRLWLQMVYVCLVLFVAFAPLSVSLDYVKEDLNSPLVIIGFLEACVGCAGLFYMMQWWLQKNRKLCRTLRLMD